MAISAGYNHSLALRADGYVLAWGRNENGQIGDGTNAYAVEPVLVEFPPVGSGNAPPFIVAISAGWEHSLAVSSDGEVWAWGGNDFGELGLGTTSLDPLAHAVPEPIPGFDDAVAVAADYHHSVALQDDGIQRSVWGWGRNQWGEVGDGTTTQRLSPVQTIAVTSAERVAVGQLHSYAIEQVPGTAWSWGLNGQGQLGYGSADSNPHPTPATISGLSDVIEIDGGWVYGAALVRASPRDRVYAWGSDPRGELGQVGCPANSGVPPVQVDLGTETPVGLSAGYEHVLVLIATGEVRAWGENDAGQLGLGGFPDSGCHNDPEVVLADATPSPVALAGIAAVSAGQNHSLALSSVGDVFSWGDDSEGQLGRDVPPDQTLAALITTLGPGAPDPVPADPLGNILMGVKSPDLRDVDLSWIDPGAPLSTGLFVVSRDENDKARIGTTPITAPLARVAFSDVGTTGNPAMVLVFYNLRAVSPCSFTPGPI